MNTFKPKKYSFILTLNIHLKQNIHVYKGIYTYNLSYTRGILGGVMNTRDSQTLYKVHPPSLETQNTYQSSEYS